PRTGWEARTRHLPTLHAAADREKAEQSLIKETCPDYQGTRLRPESRTVTPGLSAGEARRLRLAAPLGAGLTGVLHLLDDRGRRHTERNRVAIGRLANGGVSSRIAPFISGACHEYPGRELTTPYLSR
ncbi:hypothetical protein ACFW1M_44135, partial [Streptomyces inhibens]|uniref:hypothetical protein n=1 Tax=Streptomyces inhibens TaxID=2293571 RepID=UPI0036D191EB